MKNVILTAIIAGAIAGIVAALLVGGMQEADQDSKEDLIKEWYAAETAVHVSPHHIRKHMAQGDDTFILVDLRSQEEYEREHVIGAVSIPAYASPEKSAYGDVERITNSFKELIEENPGKDIIVYCYSIPCMTGRKIGNMLAEQGIYVKHLGVGWNEWRYFWTMWNHEHEWNVTNVEDYTISGSDPGVFELEGASKACAIEGEFGC